MARYIRASMLIVVVMLLTMFCLYLPAAYCDTAKANNDDYKKSDSYIFLNDFVTQCPNRVFGTNGSKEGADYIANAFTDIGFDKVTKQVVSQSVEDYNVIAKIDIPNVTKQVIIGAHYDTASSLCDGAADNGAGVVALLQIAQKLKQSQNQLRFDVIFVAFTGEEQGMLGSTAYAYSRDFDAESTMFMLNIDSIVSGDKLYIYSENKNTELQSSFLKNAQNTPSALSVKPYAKGIYPEIDLFGYGYWQFAQNSDHTPFRLMGIPSVLLFSGNYDTGNWDYVESADNMHNVMNSANDTFENLENNCGEEFVNKMETVVSTVVSTLTSDGFIAIADNAKNELVSDVWYNPAWARLVAGVLLVLLVVTGVLYYKKLQKKSILGTTEIKQSKVFANPDAEDIFKF
ncbi:MAG: M28 family peptidase [Corallococcus sp.]|nr:M28 family peptidase [Corallococcus sp.]